MDLAGRLFTAFSEICGDRSFGDDKAVAVGMARFESREVLVIVTRKGATLKERIQRNFGMPTPEGYRKALRGMKLAEKFSRPVIALIDVAGAFPGPAAEERGQSEAIARNLMEMARLRVPTIAVITGEGGSGGALALAVSDRVLLLENSFYSVISPEHCANITWRDSTNRHLAAAALRFSAAETLDRGCADDLVPEPPGGAHTNHDLAAELLRLKLRQHLDEIASTPVAELVASRQAKFRQIGQFYDAV
jgi:acetyl-CoA carboxylase carboxyl transferase subunit alpha